MKISRHRPSDQEVDTAPVAKKPVSTKPQVVTTSLLPTGKSGRVQSIGEISLLLYGEMKVGKTSLTSMFPNTVHIMFEPGGKDLEIEKVEFPDMNWATFVAVLDELISGDRYDTVSLDTVAIAYDLCLTHVCHERGVEHPSDNKDDFGGTWNAVQGEFSRQMTRILQSGRGVIFVAHAEESTFETREGAKYKKIIPDLGKQARAYFKAVADVTAYYGYYGANRYLTIQGSSALDAGHRLKPPRFRTPDGLPVHSIPMFDKDDPRFDEVKAYERFIEAFEGRQVDPCVPGSAAAFTEIKPQKKGKGG